MPHPFSTFERLVWRHYDEHRRSMPWRTNTSLYYVIVSEIMLQQTQVHRVIPKFEAFVKKFPDWNALASASTKEVLREWSGLGYNRRALYLKKIAESYVAAGLTSKSTHFSQLKWLNSTRLPGLGPNTRGAVLAYAFNQPALFIETNIRSVFIHHFFARAKQKIADEKITPILRELLKDPRIKKNPREWYWALMDYGAYLKRQLPNPARKSAHHVKQKPFKGSNREIRSKILSFIMQRPERSERISSNLRHKGVAKNLRDLTREGFLVKKGQMYHIAP